jgi:hypothetical protein
MTLKQRILDVFVLSTTQLTCSEVCEVLMEKEKTGDKVTDAFHKRNYMGSVSSQLRKFVKKGISLKVLADKKGPRGGMVYTKIA